MKDCQTCKFLHNKNCYPFKVEDTEEGKTVECREDTKYNEMQKDKKTNNLQ